MVVSIIIFTTLLVLGLCILLISKWYLSGRKKLPDEFLKFKQEHQLIEHAVHSLAELNNDYFNTLANSGYTELVNIERAMRDSIKLYEDLMNNNQIEDAGKIIYYLYVRQGRKSLPKVLSSCLDERIIFLYNYANRSNELLDNIYISISKASNDLKQIVPNRRTRKRTDMLLSHVRNYCIST